jgi:uncharacterized protein with ATP-grasp and redox domains
VLGAVLVCNFIYPVTSFTLNPSLHRNNVVAAVALKKRTTTILSMTTVESSSSSSSTPISSSTTTHLPPRPKLPIPPPITSDVPNTWAYDTMSRRVNEEILERTVLDMQEDLDQPAFANIRNNIATLRRELEHAATTPLSMLVKPDDNDDDNEERHKEFQEWSDILHPYIENQDTWLTAPWMVTEFYVYRRLMDCLGYWDPNSPGYKYDPFLKPKRAGLVSSVGSAEPILSKINDLVLVEPSDTNRRSEGLKIAISIALWGNKMDLSLWPADLAHAETDVFTQILETAAENLLHDDSDLLCQYCEQLHSQKRVGAQMDIIVDNAGFELVTDLALAQYLIQSGIAKTVTFQLKSHPTFVSDALAKDLIETVDYYANLGSRQYPACCAAGQLWRSFLDNGQWVLHEDNFWVQAYAMWDMTEPLRSDMATRCNLAFVKGDANYRRLLGDRQWEYTAPFQDVVGCYFPCPVCSLRTLKAELGCGMDADQIERASKLDENWMTNGRFGVVQFGTGVPNVARSRETE